MDEEPQDPVVRRWSDALKVSAVVLVIGLLGQAATPEPQPLEDPSAAATLWQLMTGAGLVVSAIALVILMIQFVRSR